MDAIVRRTASREAELANGEYADRARRGFDLLTLMGMEPENLDPDRIDVASIMDCPLGLTYGNYMDGLREVTRHVYGTNDVPSTHAIAVSASHGFGMSESEAERERERPRHMRTYAPYDGLTAAWREVIETARTAPKSRMVLA